MKNAPTFTWPCFAATMFRCRKPYTPLQWRHNAQGGVSNNQPYDCLLNRLFRRRSKKPSKLRVTGLCAGNSPVTDEFNAQRASNAGNVSILMTSSCNEISERFSAPFLISLCLYDRLLFLWSQWRVFIWWRHQMEMYESPSQRPASDAELWCSLWSVPEQTVE